MSLKMMNGRGVLLGAVLALGLAACGGGGGTTTTDGGTTTDGATATDSATTTPDSSTTSSKGMWTLNSQSWVVGPLGPVCQDNGGGQGFVLSAATTSPTRSGITFTLGGAKPTADATYTVMMSQPGPPPAGTAFVNVAVEVGTGTGTEKHNAQSGSVMVTVAGGKVTAVLATSPSKGAIGMAIGTVSGTVTCP